MWWWTLPFELNAEYTSLWLKLSLHFRSRPTRLKIDRSEVKVKVCCKQRAKQLMLPNTNININTNIKLTWFEATFWKTLFLFLQEIHHQTSYQTTINYNKQLKWKLFHKQLKWKLFYKQLKWKLFWIDVWTWWWCLGITICLTLRSTWMLLKLWMCSFQTLHQYYDTTLNNINIRQHQYSTTSIFNGQMYFMWWKNQFYN